MNTTDKNRKKRNKRSPRELRQTGKRIAVVLSFFVVIGIAYGLSMPAITMSTSKLNCVLEEHSHNELCYDENGDCTCALAEHVHNDDCYTTVTEEPAEPEKEFLDMETVKAENESVEAIAVENTAMEEDGFEDFLASDSVYGALEDTVKASDETFEEFEPVIDQTNAEMKFREITLKKKSETDSDWIEIALSGYAVYAKDELEVTLHDMVIDGGMFVAPSQTIRYMLPESLFFQEEINGIVTYDDYAIGSYKIRTDRIMEICFAEEVCQKNINGEAIIADLVFRARLNESKIREDHVLELRFLKDTEISLNIIDEQEEENEEDTNIVEFEAEKEVEENVDIVETEPETESEEDANVAESEPETENEEIKENDHRFGFGIKNFFSQIGGLNELNAPTVTKETITPTGTVDFKEWITEVELLKAVGWGSWQPVTGGQISKDDNLQFKLSYLVPGNQLDEAHNTIQYQIPEGINVTQKASAAVYNEAGQVIGQYTIQGSTISITFNELLTAENAAGNAIRGTIRFEAQADESAWDDEEKIKLPFNDELVVNLQQKDETVQNDDIKVEKTVTNIDHQAGTISYQIVVSSKTGTNAPVDLKDVLTGLTFNGDITIQESLDSPPVFNKINNDSEFNTTLPKLEANGSYTITYTAKIPENYNSSNSEVKNKVTATSKDSNDNTVKDESEITSTIDHVVLSKNGSVQEQDNGKILWTIQINGNNKDLNGWTLKDVLNNEDYTGTVTITPAVQAPGGGETTNTINLPYTFQESTNTIYTITYETDSISEECPIGVNQVKNKAELLPPQSTGKPGISTGEIGAGDVVTNNPLSKEGVSVVPNDDNQTATATWMVTIAADKGGFPDEWTFTDAVYGDINQWQWYTIEQLQGIETALAAALQEQNLTLDYTLQVARDGYDSNSYQNFSDIDKSDTSGNRYQAYRIKFTTPLRKGESFTFTYESTVPLVDLTNDKTFYNKANINDKVYSDATVTYTPEYSDKLTVKKVDGETGVVGTTEHTWDNVDKTLSWKIYVNVPENYSGDPISVREIFPKGVDLDKLNMTIEFQGVNGYQVSLGCRDNEDVISQIWASDVAHEVHTYLSKSDNAVTISTADPWLADSALSRICITVNVGLASDVEWTTDSENQNIKFNTFENKVELWSNDTKSDGASQSQKITVVTKENEKEEGKIEKKLTVSNVEDNIIPYRLDINKAGDDLVQDSDTIVLQDLLSVQGYPSGYNAEKNETEYFWFSAALVPGSLRVYHRNENGEMGAELSPNEYTVTYKEETVVDEWNPPTVRRYLIINLPDATPLIVTYNYKASGSIGANGGYKNVATLSGVPTGGSTGEVTTSVHIGTSGATADTEKTGIVLYKVDEKNVNQFLQGAEFTLKRYAPNRRSGSEGGDYVEDGTYTTSSANGSVILSNLAYNTAYILEETKAPSGYKLSSKSYEFYVYNSDKSSYPDVLPENFDGVMYRPGDGMYISNEKEEEQFTSIEVVKEWQDSDGNSKVVTSGSITVQLQQKVRGQENSESKWINYGEPVEFTHDTAKAWKHTVNDLPVADKDGNTYVYRVKELSVNGYDVSYSENNTEGIEGGTIKITNREKQTYILPETGSSGTRRYIISGVSLVLMAFALLLYKKTNGGRRSCD